MTNLGHGPLIMGLVWTLTAIAMATVGLRFFLRVKFVGTIGWDDWLMLVALCFQLTCSSMVSVAFTEGLGRHDVDMTFNQAVDVTKWIWIQSIPGILVSIIARISIIILLVRIFGKRIWFKWFLYCTGIVQTSLAIALIPVIMTGCTPVQGLWDPEVTARCRNPLIEQDLGYAVQSMFTFSDLTYVLLPCLFVWKLNMSIRRKLGLIAVLCLGLFTMAASIMKVVSVTSSSSVTDALYRASISLLWAMLEQLLVIIMGCIPPLRRVAKLEPPAYIKSFMSSISSLVSNSFRRPSGEYDSDFASRQPSTSLGSRQNEKKQSMASSTTYKVSSVHEHSSRASSLENGQIHKAVDFTIDHDREGV